MLRQVHVLYKWKRMDLTGLIVLLPHCGSCDDTQGSFLFPKWTYHGHFISKRSKDENMQISHDLQWGNKQQI